MACPFPVWFTLRLLPTIHGARSLERALIWYRPLVFTKIPHLTGIPAADLVSVQKDIALLEITDCIQKLLLRMLRTASTTSDMTL